MENLHQVGVGKIDITPDYPIRLSGYGARREETSYQLYLANQFLLITKKDKFREPAR